MLFNQKAEYHELDQPSIRGKTLALPACLILGFTARKRYPRE